MSMDPSTNQISRDRRMPLSLLRSVVSVDYRSSVMWALLSVVAGLFSAYAYSSLQAGIFSAVMAFIFCFGGVMLILNGRRTLRDFEKLISTGRQSDAWIELRNSGGGDSGSDTLCVLVYDQDSSPRPSIIFETKPTLSARSLKLRQRHRATLLSRDERQGKVAVFVVREILIPNGRVRHVMT